jgi:HK97 gp10 family phage protein
MAIKSFEIDGLTELIKAFEKFGGHATEQLGEASTQGAEIVLRRAKRNVEKHYKKGDLFHSLKVTKPNKRSKSAQYRVFAKVSFGKGGAHGVPLELGHRLIIHGKQVGVVREYPFMRPAADESKNEVVEVIAEAMNKALDEMGGRK